MIEAIVGQLVERFSIQSIKSKDRWHLATKAGRKISAHTVAFLLRDHQPRVALSLRGKLAHWVLQERGIAPFIPTYILFR